MGLSQYEYRNKQGITYYLNSKIITLNGGKKQTIYYFSRDVRPEAASLPEGYVVVENPRNGFLALKKESK